MIRYHKNRRAVVKGRAERKINYSLTEWYLRAVKEDTNVAMTYVDYKKEYDMIPHSWVLKSLQLVGAADNIMDVLEKSMEKWKVQLNAGDEVLGDINIKRGLFLGDSL